MQEKRFLWLAIAIILVFIAIIFRLFYWQIINQSQLAAAAASQHWAEIPLPALRGQILDRDNYPLVDNQPAFDLFLDRSLSQTPDQQINIQILPLIEPDPIKQASQSAHLTEITNNPSHVWIKLFPQVKPEIQQQILQLKIPGLTFQPTYVRRYPEASSAAHLLGFVAANSADQPQGYFGLEGYYDLELSGQTGKNILEIDAIGNPIVFGQYRQQASQPGRTLITNIDRTIQYLIETKLEQALTKYQAKAGTISLMDPRTGAIIAMSASPDYHPGDIHNYPTQYFPNPIINQSFEPGSTIKIIIMSAAINEGLVDSQTVCPCKGPISIPPYVISTWDNQYHPNSSIKEIIQHSDNVGMVYISQLFKPEIFVRYLKDFGFGQPTNIDLEEEDYPALREMWRDIDIATASFGQGIAVTPLQMLTAAAAIANHGLLMQPQVVDKIIINSPPQNRDVSSQENSQTIDISPQSVRQVISSQSAQLMTDIMVNAVIYGEAKWTAAKGYHIAGKTGTAQIPVAGHYDTEK